MNRARITEASNPRSASLDTRPTIEILRIISREDDKVPRAVRRVLPQIARAVNLVVEALLKGGRIIYLGAGTSGRLGVLDAAECVPTFGTDRVVAVMAGAPEAMLRPSEGSEDNPRRAAGDLRRIKLSARDVVVGISAGGATPYTLGGMRYAKKAGSRTVAVTCNPGAPLARLAHVSIVPVVGPEVIAGSTRMKSGTAQKLVLNMLSTASMVRWGRVLSNRMIAVQLTSQKLRRRACSILAETAGASPAEAERVLNQSGGRLPEALLMLWRGISRKEAEKLLASGSGVAAVLRAAQTNRRPSRIPGGRRSKSRW